MTTNLIIQLLLQIHLYYPIGIPILNKEFPGFKLIHEKVTKKIDQIIEKYTTEWSRFIADCKQKFKPENIMDCAYYQYPSYFCKIELEKNEYNGIIFKKTINVSVSLLSEFYTIYFEDFYDMPQYKSLQILKNTDHKRVFYMKSLINKKGLDQINLIKEFITRHFPNYQYVSHFDLLSTKVVGGLPYGKPFDSTIEDNYKYSLYEFLFDCNLDTRNLDLLE